MQNEKVPINRNKWLIKSQKTKGLPFVLVNILTGKPSQRNFNRLDPLGFVRHFWVE